MSSLDQNAPAEDVGAEAQKSLLELADIIERCPGAIVVHQAGRVLYANLAARQCLGASETDSLVGRDFGEFVRAGDRPAWEAMRAGADQDTNELRLVGLDERAIVVALWHATGVRFSGQDAAILHIQDISGSRAVQRDILKAVVDEHERIAVDLHGGLGQLLAAVQFKCEAVRMRLTDSSPEGAAQLDEIYNLVNDASQQARAVGRRLDPVDIPVGGLAVALRELARRTGTSQAIVCTFDSDETDTVVSDTVVLDKLAATQMYRIAEEAINNAVQHGKAERIAITLGPETTGVCMDIRSHGPVAHSTGNDQQRIDCMHYWARTIGASLNINLSNAGVTVLRCTLPSEL